ncbi:MAG: SDR family oxidoreductase [Bryobacteraceae bacterium]|nr:SDR family oxidoreductase [Bryobacteraceae bacterium]
MKLHLKKLKDQVMVITGASSGIGLTTARMAAQRGARVVVAARNEDALRDFVEDVRDNGGQAHYVVADVESETDIRKIAQEAITQFGGFDTWVNNAGKSIYGPIKDVDIDDARTLFETNFWGVVHGSRVAVEHLRANGGALINIGSEVSDIAAPLQGFYSSSKHAVKGFTDALRMELEEDKAPVSVTLIKPGPIDTPFTQHAKNLLPDEPTHVAPVYSPDIVAGAILFAAEHPVRDQLVGGGAKLMTEVGRWAPRVADKLMQSQLIKGTHSGRPATRDREGALYKPGFGGQERGDYSGHVHERSLYTTAALHPIIAGALGLGVAVAFAVLVRSGLSSDN